MIILFTDSGMESNEVLYHALMTIRDL